MRWAKSMETTAQDGACVVATLVMCLWAGVCDHQDADGEAGDEH